MRANIPCEVNRLGMALQAVITPGTLVQEFCLNVEGVASRHFDVGIHHPSLVCPKGWYAVQVVVSIVIMQLSSDLDAIEVVGVTTWAHKVNQLESSGHSDNYVHK